MLDTDTVELTFLPYITEEDVVVCTWISFVNENADGFEGDPEELQRIADTLDAGEIYFDGGGASASFQLKKVN